MRVLVTGAAGFLGRPIANALMERGHEVWCLDLTNAHHRLPDAPVKIGGYIQDPMHLPNETLDAVIHLAAVAAPADCLRDPALAFSVNVLGTYNILNLALSHEARRFLLASTAHVYGISPKYLPTDEYHQVWNQDVYTVTKILDEQLCHLFYINYGLSYCALRLYNGYGPGQTPGYFIPDMIQKAKGGAIDLKGWDITKDWVYIDDVVEAYVRAVESQYVGAINIGTGREENLGHIAARIALEFGATLSTSPAFPATRMCADRSRAKNVLGWEPQVTLEEGLERTIKHWLAAGVSG